MFPFKKPPSRAEVAKQAVIDSVSGAANSLSHHAHDLLENAHDLIENTLETAQHKLTDLGGHLENAGESIGAKVEAATDTSALDKAKLVAGSASVAGAANVAQAATSTAQKLGALKAGATAGAALAGKSVADKVGETVAAVRDGAGSSGTDVAVPDVKRARKQAQNEINDMNKKAAKYQRELQKELARDQQMFLAEQERMQREYEKLQADLETARRAAQAEQSDLAKRQRNYDDKHDIVRVPLAPTDEVVAVDADGDGDFRYDEEKSGGGGNTWLILGAVLLASAGAVYYLFSSTDGRRKRAQIQDRVGQVAEGVREKITHDSDETGEATTAEVAEAATEAFDRSNEKIVDDAGKMAGNIEAKLPPTSGQSLPDKAVDKIGEVGDKVADGIAGAGAFLADKLEAAGAGAKSAAHSAAEKMDDVKDKAVAKLDDAKKLPATTAGATAVPDAVVVEVITDEPVTSESPEEILAEVEQTVRNIENSVREEKK